jgi:hypothetical protein
MMRFLAIVGLMAAGIAGYLAEPSMRYQLTGHSPQAGQEVATAPSEQPPSGSLPAQPVLPPKAVEPVIPSAPPTPPPVATNVVPTPQPTPEVVPEPVAPAVTSVVDPIMPPPAPEPVEPTPEPSPAPPPVSTANVVEVMKAHITGGNLKEFTFNQVHSWEAAPDEVINGETFQIGMVRYKAETIFGDKLIEAKALIQNGQVVRWIWPRGNLEIK